MNMAKDQPAEKITPTEDTMERFDTWFKGVGDYLTDVGRELHNHPDPDEYCRQMDAVIAAKEADGS